MTKKLILMAVIATALATSCKKKTEKPQEDEPLKLNYSNLSVEEHKKSLEQNGTNFLTSVNSLPDEKFIDVIKDFVDLNEISPVNTDAIGSLISVSSSAQNKDFNGVFSVVATEGVKNLDEKYGVYTWNSSSKTWIETPSNNKLEIIFPTKGSSTNNARLTSTHVASGISTTIDGETYTLPSNVTSSLVVDNKEELKLVSNYAYKSNGTPTLANVNLTMGAYSFVINAKNEVGKVSSSLKLAKGDNTLLSFATEINGNVDINANNIDIIDNANATFEIMNIKLIGSVDTKSIINELSKFDNLSDKDYNAKEAELYNKYALMHAVYKNDNTVIAKVIFAPTEKTHSYQIWDGSRYVTYTYTNYSIDPQLVFKDDSKLSFEVFAQTGFSKLIDDLDKFSKRFE